jgi:hypothetical protein
MKLGGFFAISNFSINQLTVLEDARSATATFATSATGNRNLNVANVAEVAVAAEGGLKSPLFNEVIFNRLYAYLEPLSQWVEADRQAWVADFREDSKTTIECLEALVKSWGAGRCGNLIESDWECVEDTGLSSQRTPNSIDQSCDQCQNLTSSRSCIDSGVWHGSDRFTSWVDSRWQQKRRRCKRFKIKPPISGEALWVS